MRVAVLDTNFDVTHPDLAPNILGAAGRHGDEPFMVDRDKADRLLCELTGCLADLKRYRDRVTRPSIAKEHVRAAARHDAALAPSMR